MRQSTILQCADNAFQNSHLLCSMAKPSRSSTHSGKLTTLTQILHLCMQDTNPVDICAGAAKTPQNVGKIGQCYGSCTPRIQIDQASVELKRCLTDCYIAAESTFDLPMKMANSCLRPVRSTQRSQAGAQRVVAKSSTFKLPRRATLFSLRISCISSNPSA